MVRQAHHERVEKDFAIVLCGMRLPTLFQSIVTHYRGSCSFTYHKINHVKRDLKSSQPLLNYHLDDGQVLLAIDPYLNFADGL